MSDLSRLLDDVYRSGAPAAAEPAWSSDRALDDAFENWVPGPPAEASEEERSYAQDWADVAGNVPEAAVAFTEALTEQQAPPPADSFAALHALLEEAIRLTPGADPAPEAAVEAAVEHENEPEPAALFLAYAEAEPEPEPEAFFLAYAEAEPEPDPDPEASFLAYATPEPTPEPEAAFLAYAEAEPAFVPTVEVAEVIAPTYVAPVPVAGWTRSDDDILPVGRTGRGVKLLRRRR